MSYGSLSFTSQIQNTLMKILSKTCFVFQYFYVLCYLQDFLFFLLFVLFLVILYAVFKVQVRFLCKRTDNNRLAAYANFRFRALYSHYREHGGDKGNRTLDLLLARQALSQLSYAPTNSGSGPED